MIVCLCHRISDRDIAGHARAGCASFESLQEDTRLGTACAACLECARDAFVQACQAREAARPRFVAVSWQALPA
jgi:bacterioferritin-associated ferredoxin